MPGVLEWNVALQIGTSIHRVRQWRGQCPEFDEALQVMESTRSAHIMQQFEQGAVSAKVADRIVYTNLRESIEAPKRGTAMAAPLDQVRLAAIELPGGLGEGGPLE